MKKPLSIAVNFKLPAALAVEEWDLDRSTEPRFCAEFPGLPGEPAHRVDFSDFGHRSKLAAEFASYLQVTGGILSIGTRESAKKHFRAFVCYLDSYEELFGICVASVRDLTSKITTGYGDWLNGNRHIGSSLKLVNSVKNTRNNAVKRFVRYYQVSPKTRDVIAQDLKFHSAWPVSPSGSRSKPSISVVDIAAIRKASKDKIKDVADILRRSLSIIDDPTISVPDLRHNIPQAVQK